jgi:hypothetical protein
MRPGLVPPSSLLARNLCMQEWHCNRVRALQSLLVLLPRLDSERLPAMVVVRHTKQHVPSPAIAQAASAKAGWPVQGGAPSCTHNIIAQAWQWPAWAADGRG